MRKYIFLFFTFITFTSFAADYKLSDAGKQNIMDNESCSLTAYWDSNGWSIGYGHHGADVKKGMTITKKQAIAYFNKDVAWVNNAINRIIDSLPAKHNFSQKFIDGLGDLIYNCGEDGIKKSTFYKRLKACRKNNRKDLEFTIAAVRDCRISAPGHKSRRYDTQIMMLD